MNSEKSGNKKILVALSTFGRYGEEPLNVLQKSGMQYAINTLGRRLAPDEIIKMGKDCAGVIAGVEPYNDYVLGNMPKLRCISRCGVGVDNISLAKAEERGIEIRTTPQAVIQPVAELTVAMALDLIRRLSWQSALVKSGRWEKKAGRLFSGRRIGLLGLGRIGRRVAEIMSGLGTTVYGTDLVPDRKWAHGLGVKIVSLEELLHVSDILSIHLSFREDAPFLLGTEEIGKMKKGAMVINVSRGNFIDEEALYVALKGGRLAGAALDTFSEEPYSGRLCGLENVILTPHIGTLTEESRLEMEVEASKNLVDVLTR